MCEDLCLEEDIQGLSIFVWMHGWMNFIEEIIMCGCFFLFIKISYFITNILFLHLTNVCIHGIYIYIYIRSSLIPEIFAK
jgi:hypothetical protein